MNGRLRKALQGALAGSAAETTALNAVGYRDMALRGRRASTTPEQVVEQVARRCGLMGGFSAVRVDDVFQFAQTSHGIVYRYFSSKEIMVKTLLRDALHDMKIIAAAFRG